MKTLAETIIRDFAECLQDGLEQAPKGSKFIAVHVSSCHMSIFWESYTNIQNIETDMAAVLIDGQAYSQIKLVWDIEGESLVYYDSMGFLSGAHDYCEQHKNDPKPPPVYVPATPPQPTHPNVKSDHYCQADPGTPEICYFCGGPVVKVDTSKTSLAVVFKKPEPDDEIEEEDEDLGLDDCTQCGEEAWDGYICHACGAKHI